MQKHLKDFKGKEPIFIDANIFLHHAFDQNPRSVEFLKMVEVLTIKAYTSALVIEEVMFKLVMQSASNFLKKGTLQEVKVFLRDAINKEKVFKPVMLYREFIDTLKDLGLMVLDLTDKDMSVALQRAKTYGLITADAAHLAVMERKGIAHIASNDCDFKVVSTITLWTPD